MALSWYNGFSPEQRDRSQHWLNAQFAAGLPRPTRCQACGQEHGAIDYHTEDYSEPFGPHIHGFSLCYRCHIILHCRRRNPAAWDRYREALRNGWRFPPMWRNWSAFQKWLSDFSRGDGLKGVVFTDDRHASTVLDEIHDGIYNPNHGK